MGLGVLLESLRPSLVTLYPSNVLERLSEKGYEQRSERAFGGCTEAKMGQNTSSRRSLRLSCRWLPGFSDSLRREVLRSLQPNLA